MNAGPLSLSACSFAVATLAYLSLGLYLLRSKSPSQGERAAFVASVLAAFASAIWAASSLADEYASTVAPAFLAAVFDLLRYTSWLIFLLIPLRPQWRLGRGVGVGGLPATVGAAIAFSTVALCWHVLWGQNEADPSALGRTSSLVLAIVGVLLTEQLFRNIGDDSRWSAKPVCLALAFIFAFDIYLYSEALLFGQFDSDALSIRGLVHSLSVPLLWLAARRRGNSLGGLQVSRSVAFFSSTLVLAGVYMLFMAALGYYVRYFGGTWGRALQMGLAFAGALFLLVMAFSGAMRSHLRVFIGKNFFSYRYDYRQEWLRFTSTLSTRSGHSDVGGMVVHGLADMVESPGGDLWTRDSEEFDFHQTARWNVPQIAAVESAASSLVGFLREKSWVIDLDEFHSAPRRYGALVLPTWLTAQTNIALVVPLLVGDELLGFATLVRPRAAMELNWEVRDLLKTASRQAAVFMAQMQATEALLESRKFDAFNKMSAFVVHDLKNIVTQLSLMLRNAERLQNNAEFQQDMLSTVQSSLEKMKRLMLQLREGSPQASGAHGVELAPIIKRLGASAAESGRHIEISSPDRLATRGHSDRIERVFGHLVHNALDATPVDGRVWIRLLRVSGQVVVEVGDTGVGMTEDFVNKQLFRPFNSTKPHGMGIGAYESAQYVRELGGSIEVASRLGQGTLVRVMLPAFETFQGSDLRPSVTP